MNQLLDRIRTTKGDVRIYLFIFLLAIGLRILFLFFIDEPILFGKYPYFAEKLASGQGIGDRIVDLSPFYLYLLASLKRLFDIDWHTLKGLQAAVGAANCLLVMAVGTAAFRKEIGLLAALLCAVYGNLIILESTLEPTVFVVMFNLLSILFLYRAKKNPRPGATAVGAVLAAGLCTGLSIITKPNFLLFLPIAVGWLLFRENRGKLQLQSAFLYCAAAALVIAPITARNYIYLKDFVLVTADAGKVFYHGNAKGASALEGTGLPDEGFAEEAAGEPDYAHVLFRKTAARLAGRPLSPSASSLFWFQQTVNDIYDDIPGYLVRQWKKLLLFFNDYEMHYIASAYKEYKKSLGFPFLRYGMIASLGLLGMCLSAGAFRRHALIFGSVVVYLVSGLLFLVQSRYRTPAVPYLALFAGAAVFRFREMVLSKKFRMVGLALVLFAGLFAASLFFNHEEIRETDRWQKATKIHYQLGARPFFQAGRYADALAELNRSIALAPRFSPAYNLRGKIYGITGDADAALADFQTVIELSPNLPDGYKNTGFLHLLRGNEAGAKPYLQRALELNPGDQKVMGALDAIR